MTPTPEAIALGRTLWDYHRLGHELTSADAIIVLGSHDVRVASRGAEVWLEGRAPTIVFSGYLGTFTRGMWTRAEADVFAEVARKMGVPDRAIVLEAESTHTGENVAFSRRRLADRGIVPRTVIAVQKPYMERRAFATFGKIWPELVVRVTSPRLDFDAYPNEEIDAERVIHVMVGDLQRILIYPKRGFAVAQEVPDEVLHAYERLVELGYTEHLTADAPD